MSELPYDQRDRNLAVLLHLSSFAGILVPYAGFVRADNHLVGVQGIGFREPARIHFLQRLNFLYYLRHCKRCALFDPHRISTFVRSIYLGYLGAY